MTIDDVADVIAADVDGISKGGNTDSSQQESSQVKVTHSGIYTYICNIYVN